MSSVGFGFSLGEFNVSKATTRGMWELQTQPAETSSVRFVAPGGALNARYGLRIQPVNATALLNI